MKGTWLEKVFSIWFTRKKCNIMKCMSQYLRIMSLKLRWVRIWATFGIQTIAWCERGIKWEMVVRECVRVNESSSM